MNTTPGQSTGGLDAALHRSAVMRTWGVLVVALIFLVVVVVRTFFDGLALNLGPLVITLFLIAFEGGLLFWLRSPKRDLVLRPLPVAVHTVVECSLPTAVVAATWLAGIVPAPVVLITPAVVGYSVFIALSILWLRPWLTALAGATCAVGHLSLLLIAGAMGRLESDLLPVSILATYPILLGVVGGASWFVTARMRAYVESAILEAERRTAAEGELEAASVVQQGLLPGEPPSLAGWSVAGWNRPAEQTGGDYWDWTQLPDGKVAVSIADVTGHGLGPAVVTAFCRAYARSSIHDSAGLVLAMQRVARLLADDMPSGRFVTYAVALLTPDAGRVPLLSAGHGPTLLVRAADGHVDQFGADDLPLGVMADMAFDDIPELDLKPGDSLMMLTDGFFEWHNPAGKQWGLDRLAESAAQHRHLDPPKMIAALLADVEAFAQGTTQMDDLTAVVIRRSAH
ncbi:MAG: SpoIIE family protein phosphatase [Planctomycetota bacterium]